MKQLDPKAFWLFFLGAAGTTLFSFIVLFIFLGSIIIELIEDFRSTGNENVLTASDVILSPGVILVLVFFALFFILTFIWAKLSYKYYRYELAEMGFKKEYGVIWKRYVTIPYDRIQNVDIIRGVLARMLGLSDLQIQTAGVSGVAATEGRLPGLSTEEAERLRDELIQRARHYRDQGL